MPNSHKLHDENQRSPFDQFLIRKSVVLAITLFGTLGGGLLFLDDRPFAGMTTIIFTALYVYLWMRRLIPQSSKERSADRVMFGLIISALGIVVGVIYVSEVLGGDAGTLRLIAMLVFSLGLTAIGIGIVFGKHAE